MRASSPYSSLTSAVDLGPCSASGETSGSVTSTSYPCAQATPLAHSRTSESAMENQYVSSSIFCSTGSLMTYPSWSVMIA